MWYVRYQVLGCLSLFYILHVQNFQEEENEEEENEEENNPENVAANLEGEPDNAENTEEEEEAGECSVTKYHHNHYYFRDKTFVAFLLCTH